MTIKEIVKELVDSYSAGDTECSFHPDWFMIRISKELREELSKRMHIPECITMLDDYHSLQNELRNMSVIE